MLAIVRRFFTVTPKVLQPVEITIEAERYSQNPYARLERHRNQSGVRYFPQGI